MLKYLLSTLCIFLFFEDVRLNHYKCASEDCSVSISRARVTITYPKYSDREINVEKGDYVDVHGVDSANINYLVKVKENDGLYLLPKTVLKEDTNILQKAKLEVRDPFQLNSSHHRKTPTKREASEVERFKSIIANISHCSLKKKNASSNLANQSPSVENEKKNESPTDAVAPKPDETRVDTNEFVGNLTADEPKILDNNTNSEDNKPDSSNSETNTLDEKEKENSKSPQTDSTVENSNQTNISVAEESKKKIVGKINKDLVEQQNNSQVRENNSSDLSASPSNLSNPPSSESKPDQSNPKPKIAQGDNPASFMNYTSDENQTSSVRNDSSSNTSPSDDLNLNETNALAGQNDPSTKPQSTANNSKTLESNETMISEPSYSTLKQNDISKKEKSTDKADNAEALQGNVSISHNTSAPSENKPNMPSLSEANQQKSGLPNENVRSKSAAANSANKRKANEEALKFNPENQNEVKNETSVKKEGTPGEETVHKTTSPNPNSSTSSKDEKLKSNNEETFANSTSAEKSGLSPENVSSDLNKSIDKDPTPETIKASSAPGTSDSSSSTDKPPLTDDRKHLNSPTHLWKLGQIGKNAPPKSDKSEDVNSTRGKAPPSTQSVSYSSSSSSSSNSSAVVPSKSDDNVTFSELPPPGKTESLDENASLDSDVKGPKSKPAAENVEVIPETSKVDPSEVKVESESNSPKIHTVPETSTVDPSEVKVESESNSPKIHTVPETSKVDPSEVKVESESNSPKIHTVPETSTVDPSEVKVESESNSPKIPAESGAKPADFSPEKEHKSTSLEALLGNIDGSSADHGYDGSEDSNQSLEEVILKEESAFYMDVFGYIGNFSSLFENLAGLQSYLNFEWLQKQNDSVEQHCDEESCSAFSIFDSMAKYGFDVSAINFQSWSLAEMHQSKQTSLVAGIVLCAVLLFTTLISILRNSKKKSRINTLISVVNQLEKKLLVATKEISLLEEQLTDAPVTLISQPVTEVDYESSELLQQQIELLQVRNTDLEDKVTYLEKELHNVTTSAFEMHKLLENSLSTQAQSRLAEDEVDTLRTLTERQDRQIDDLMKEMDAIVTENRYLKDDLKKMEKEYSSQTKKNLELSEKNRSLSLRLDQQIEETATMKNNYKSEIYQLQAKIEDLEINLRRSEFQVESLNRAFMDKHENKSDDQMQALQDDVQLKLQLSTLKAMNNELSAELKEQKNARRTLDDHIGDVIRKCNELTQALEVSEKGRSEAINKLQVLTDYFNEKESQLQKEIAEKEKLFMESESKDQLLSQKLSSLKEEIKNNKDRNEELKKEIEAQERSFKTQLATAEQKSRDLWFALRQAERKYQESEKEAATLRNKILILENNLSSANQKLNEKHSTNGDLNGQPLMFSAEMLSYRGPNDFIPPPPSPLASHSPEFFPPEPSYSPDERLPPLGGRRVPSPPSLIVPPPDDDDFKPPLPHAQYMPGRSRHDSLNMSSFYGDNSQYN